MLKYISIGSLSEKIPVTDFAMYHDGNTTPYIQFNIDTNIKTVAELNQLFNSGNNDIIKTWNLVDSEYELVDEYHNFCAKFKFTYQSKTNNYCIKLYKKSETEILMEENEADTMDAYEALAALYELKV